MAHHDETQSEDRLQMNGAEHTVKNLLTSDYVNSIPIFFFFHSVQEF